MYAGEEDPTGCNFSSSFELEKPLLLVGFCVPICGFVNA